MMTGKSWGQQKTDYLTEYEIKTGKKTCKGLATGRNSLPLHLINQFVTVTFITFDLTLPG